MRWHPRRQQAHLCNFALAVNLHKLQSELEREWLWRRYEALVAESLTAEQRKGLAEEMLRYMTFFSR